MKLIAALAVSVPMLVAQPERPALRSVTAIRHWSLTDVTRVAIEVSGEFKFTRERLHSPERIYFDISDARPRIDSKRVYTEQLDDKLVKRIRVAETVPNVTRVVLDLGDSVEATNSQLTNPDRLIVEVRAAGTGASAAQVEQAPVVKAPVPQPVQAPAAIRADPRKPDPPPLPKPLVKTPVSEPPPAEPSIAQLAKPAPVPSLPPSEYLSTLLTRRNSATVLQPCR